MSFPESVAPTLARWPFMDRHGRLAFWRCVMTRAAWDALPDEARYEAVPSEDGSFVTCDVPASASPTIGQPAPLPHPNLSGVSVEGRICGTPMVGIFVPADDWEAIPADRKPPALRERTGRWYLAFEEVPGAMGADEGDDHEG